LFQYFGEFEYYYAHDPEKICKTGDMVLIQQLPEKLTRLITHKVLEVVYTCGDITDPITGRKVVVSKYRYIISLFVVCYTDLFKGSGVIMKPIGLCLLSDEKLIQRA
jgi:hypothetical protein